MSRKKIVIAPDAFKDSLKASQICDIVKNVILDAYQGFDIDSIPLADGGEGFLDILHENLKLKIITLSVLGPLKEKVKASYGIKGDIAFLEMAQSSGLQLLQSHERNPFNTTTFGLGELIKDGIQRGMRNFVLGIGGSATCDGGAGMAQALGAEFYDKNGKLIKKSMTGLLLGRIADIDCSALEEKIKNCTFQVASDVTNPLLGKHGAVYVYAPQKGLDPADLPFLERNMENLNSIFQNKLGIKVNNLPGAGAAGGLGAGLVAFLDAELKSGSKFILDILNFENRIENASVIITGEGQIDKQTMDGKIISEIINIAEKFKIPLYVLCGRKRIKDPDGIEDVVALTEFTDKHTALKEPEKYLQIATRQLLKNIV